MTEEPFGPITAITTFKDFDEVIKRVVRQSEAEINSNIDLKA